MQDINIVSYDKQYAQNFYDLNVEWLRAYFYVEPYDEKVLSNPEKYIIEQGGFIFFVLKDEKVIGTVALVKVSERVYELSRMAVTPILREQKIGQHLLQFVLNFAQHNSFDKILLYSNRRLKNALHVYEKYGFKEIPLEANNPYVRGDIKMELIL